MGIFNMFVVVYCIVLLWVSWGSEPGSLDNSLGLIAFMLILTNIQMILNYYQPYNPKGKQPVENKE